MCSSGVFFIAVREALMQQECVSSNAKGGVVVKAAPVAPFVMPQAKLLLELPVVTLDAPAHLGHMHQTIQGCVGRQGAQEVFHGFGMALRPLDQ
ncbi:hypothetical protein OA56_08835 [Tepidiphilus sp. HLB4]